MKKKMQITDVDMKSDPAYVRVQYNDEPIWRGIQIIALLRYIARTKGWFYDTLNNHLVIPHSENRCTIMSFKEYYKFSEEEAIKFMPSYVDSTYQEDELETIDSAINERKNGF